MLTLNRYKITPSLLLFPILITLVFVAPLLEARPNLSGTWSGIVTDSKDGAVKVVLTIESDDKSNALRYFLHYQSPRTCRLKAEELLAEEDNLILKFNEANGGFCDKLYNGMMTITIENRKQLSALIESKSKKISESVTLKKQ